MHQGRSGQAHHHNSGTTDEGEHAVQALTTAMQLCMHGAPLPEMHMAWQHQNPAT